MSTPTEMAPTADLNEILMAEDVSQALWAAIDCGRIDALVPELPALRMEQDPIHRHKDVLSHTVAVRQDPFRPDRSSRKLFHDIAKPKTRSFEHGGVTFRHHEVVGGRMTRKRMTAMGYDEQTVEAVAELVRLSGRFKGYADGWSDAAVRRHQPMPVRFSARLSTPFSDCTTRNRNKAQALQESIDDLERRIAELAEEDRRAAERPQIDGEAVMAHLGIGPGRHVGEIMRWLLELKRTEGHLDEEELLARLDADWAERSSAS